VIERTKITDDTSQLANGALDFHGLAWENGPENCDISLSIQRFTKDISALMMTFARSATSSVNPPAGTRPWNGQDDQGMTADAKC
jgi:hypothetical protein